MTSEQKRAKYVKQARRALRTAGKNTSATALPQEFNASPEERDPAETLRGVLDRFYFENR